MKKTYCNPVAKIVQYSLDVVMESLATMSEKDVCGDDLYGELFN